MARWIDIILEAFEKRDGVIAVGSETFLDEVREIANRENKKIPKNYKNSIVSIIYKHTDNILHKREKNRYSKYFYNVYRGHFQLLEIYEKKINKNGIKANEQPENSDNDSKDGRRLNFTFEELQIETGETLHLEGNPDIICKVVGSVKVNDGEEEGYLKTITNKYKPELDYVSGLKHWNYKGELLFDRRLRLEEKIDAIKIEENIKIQKFYDLSEKQGLSETEREVAVKIRIGQGSFREELYRKWQGCSVTGYKEKEMLIASHIRPWSKSDDKEKLDVENGLLLTPNLDKAFDRGLITFDDDGTILISEDLAKPEKINITEGMQLSKKPNDKNKEYLKYHREHIFQDRDVAEEDEAD